MGKETIYDCSFTAKIKSNPLRKRPENSRTSRVNQGNKGKKSKKSKGEKFKSQFCRCLMEKCPCIKLFNK